MEMVLLYQPSPRRRSPRIGFLPAQHPKQFYKGELLETPGSGDQHRGYACPCSEYRMSVPGAAMGWFHL
jgi:hypothetical protein